MKLKISLVLVAIGMPLALSACGTDTGDRALSGAGIGAAGGAIIGAVTPVGPLGGALIGGAVGGATGALTSPSQVNLGKPVWRGEPGPARTSSSGHLDSSMVSEIQADLQRRGYNVGPADGRLGPRTEAAIREYQEQHGLAVDGRPSAALLDYMQSHQTG